MPDCQLANSPIFEFLQATGPVAEKSHFHSFHASATFDAVCTEC